LPGRKGNKGKKGKSTSRSGADGNRSASLRFKPLKKGGVLKEWAKKGVEEHQGEEKPKKKIKNHGKKQHPSSLLGDSAKPKKKKRKQLEKRLGR